MTSASRSASSPASGSCSRTPSSAVRAATWWPARRGRPASLRERLAGLLGGGAQRVGEAEPRLLGGQLRVLARLPVRRPRSRRGRSAAGRPRGPAPRAGDDGSQLALGRDELVVQPRVTPPQPSPRPAHRSGRARRAGRPRSSRCWSDWPCTATSGSATLGKRGHRHGGATDEGPRAALGRDVAGQHDPVVLDLSPGLVDGGHEVGQAGDRDDALDPGVLGPGAHRPGVGATAEQQPERGDDHRLAGAGLTGDHGQARARARASTTR